MADVQELTKAIADCVRLSSEYSLNRTPENVRALRVAFSARRAAAYAVQSKSHKIWQSIYETGDDGEKTRVWFNMFSSTFAMSARCTLNAVFMNKSSEDLNLIETKIRIL